MNEVIKELFERKSVRVYSDKMIEEDKKQLIIDAAIQAPTAGNNDFVFNSLMLKTKK